MREGGHGHPGPRLLPRRSEFSGSRRPAGRDGLDYCHYVRYLFWSVRDRRSRSAAGREIGIYNPKLILDGEVWRLLTAVFLHAGILHLFFNMLVLYWTGRAMEELYGTREFLIFYLLSGIGANVLYMLVAARGSGPARPHCGAQWGRHCHVHSLRLSLSARAGTRLVRAAGTGVVARGLVRGLHGTLRFWQRAQSARRGRSALAAPGWRTTRFSLLQIGRAIHPAFRSSDEFASSAETSRRGAARRGGGSPTAGGRLAVEIPARPANAPDEQLEAKIDAVLEKVSKYGQESLTPEEREILFRASELYKKRRK